MQQLRQAGQTEQTSPELAQISQTFNFIQKHVAKMKHMQMLQQQQAMQQQQQNQAQSPTAGPPGMQQQQLPGQMYANSQPPQAVQQNGQQEGQNGYTPQALNLPLMPLANAGQPGDRALVILVCRAQH
jgi:hypothetical protein